MKTKTTQPTEYDIQASDFLKATQTKITKRYVGHTKRLGDTRTAEFEVTIEPTGRRPWTFQFNDSIVNSYEVVDSRTHCGGFRRWRPFNSVPTRFHMEKRESHTTPSDYSILACLSVCYADCLQDFCDEYGYDTDSVKARDMWLAVQDETAALRRMFTEEELEQLQEIN
jgi:hypothetical protein